MQADKYDFPSQTPGQLFIHSLNFLMLRQLLGKWEGRGKRNREYKSIRGGPWSAHTKVCNEILVSRCCWWLCVRWILGLSVWALMKAIKKNKEALV